MVECLWEAEKRNDECPKLEIAWNKEAGVPTKCFCRKSPDYRGDLVMIQLVRMGLNRRVVPEKKKEQGR